MTSCLAVCLALTALLLPAVQARAANDPRPRQRARRAVVPDTCTAQYAALENHTMCLEDHPSAIVWPMTYEDEMEVVDIHNFYRANVIPTASRMQLMVYDPVLAAVAQKWAMQCVFGHDDNRQDPKYPGARIVQNMGIGYRSFQSMLDNMYGEKDQFNWNYGDPYNNDVGHFYQMVFEGAARIGCGRADCPHREKGKTSLVCNYALGLDAGEAPYKSGDPCADCPGKCDFEGGALCNCSGKICYNGGTVNVNDCSCQCTEWWKGDLCETTACIDGLNYCQDPAVNCATWGTNCPLACGLCTVPPVCNGMQCNNGGILNEDTCQCRCAGGWGGPTCDVCPYWDMPFCGDFKLSDCTSSNLAQAHYANIYCSNMCGICP